MILERRTEEESAAFESSPKKASVAIAGFKEKCDALEAAFGGLEEPPATRGKGIPYKEVIPGIARELMLMAPVRKRKYATAQKGLPKVAAHADHTVKALDSLSDEALQALNLRPGAIRQLKTRLRILHVAAKTAKCETPPAAAMSVSFGTQIAT
jgi:hypothetical protein